MKVETEQKYMALLGQHLFAASQALTVGDLFEGQHELWKAQRYYMRLLADDAPEQPARAITLNELYESWLNNLFDKAE